MADTRYYEPVFKDNSENNMRVVAHSSNFDGASSKAAEKRWARKLKDEGYKVVGGH
jgi:hypothetical protein